MAMNDLDTTRTYTKYKRHVNDSAERVDAQTINQIQEDIQEKQEDTNTIKDTAFEERLYTIFDNNNYVNAMFKDLLENGNYINATKSSNYNLDPNLKNVSIAKDEKNATVTSIKLHSSFGEDIELNDFFIVTNEYKPVGSTIKYFLQDIHGEKYQIKANSLKTPLHLSQNIQYGFELIIEFKANDLGESPILNDYAILYWDAQIEKNMGLINPDLQRFP